MKKLLLTLTTVILAMTAFSAVSFAEDDVLSILGDKQDGKANPNAAKEKQGVDVSPFKALFPKLTPDQNMFFALLSQGENEKALLEYFATFQKSAAGQTPNGKALLAYLFIKNDMKILGVESLFKNVEPEKLGPALASAIRAELSDTDPVWKLARIDWKAKWTEVFSPSIEVQVKSKKIFTAKDIEELKNVIKVSAPNTRDRGAIQWQLVLALEMHGDSVMAAKLLNALMTSKENPVQTDLMNLTAARMLFENGYMDAAIKYYKKIPTKSEFWLDAQEETGWAYIRKGEPQNTLAATQSLIIPELQNIVGPETVFLRSLALLKVCDYGNVVKTLAMFKDRFRPRTVEMLKIIDNPEQPVVKDFFAKMQTKRLKLTELGGMAAKLPRLVTRDESLYQDLVLARELGKEGAIAQGIFGRSLANGTSKVGFQAEVEIFKNDTMAQVAAANNAAYGRLKTLAQEEVSDTHRLLQKLHIVEAEVLQQSASARKVTAATKDSKAIEKRGSTGSTARDTISFPAEDGQVWFDEIANYKVDVVKGCQAIKN